MENEKVNGKTGSFTPLLLLLVLGLGGYLLFDKVLINDTVSNGSEKKCSKCECDETDNRYILSNFQTYFGPNSVINLPYDMTKVDNYRDNDLAIARHMETSDTKRYDVLMFSKINSSGVSSKNLTLLDTMLAYLIDGNLNGEASLILNKFKITFENNKSEIETIHNINGTEQNVTKYEGDIIITVSNNSDPAFADFNNRKYHYFGYGMTMSSTSEITSSYVIAVDRSNSQTNKDKMKKAMENAIKTFLFI